MRDTLEHILGAVVLAAFIGILIAAYHRYMHRIYRRIAREWADELFRAYVKNCEYRVHTTVYTTIAVEDGDTCPCVFDDYSELVQLEGTWLQEEYDPEE